MDNNIDSWKNNSENSSYSHADSLADVSNIDNLLSHKIFSIRDSNSNIYDIYYAYDTNDTNITKYKWTNNINRCIESYLRSQICEDIDFNSDICDKVQSTIIILIRSTNDTNDISDTNDTNDTNAIYDPFDISDTNDTNEIYDPFFILDINDTNDISDTNDTNDIYGIYDPDDIYETNIKDICERYSEIYRRNREKSTFVPIDYSDPNSMEKLARLWVQCKTCYGLNFKQFFRPKMNICEHCGEHLKMSSSDRIDLSIDRDTWNPMDEDMVSVDPIKFDSIKELGSEEEEEEKDQSYIDRLDSYQEKTGLPEAVQTGTGQLNGIPLALAVMDSEFIAGSMGCVVGEKITRLIEYATNLLLPLIIVCASGGARMQEGSLSLMQMAKISSALYNYQINQKLFYVAILTSPTTGGVTASFGMLGDIIIAEPNATIAFAGKRVIEQLLNKEVPEGSQSADLLFDRGLLDAVVPRHLLKEFLTELFQFHGFVPLT
uniref:Acetyl-coenzyme A carboxylase carboxyl transferase subunit beta, chloroplastic n=1 Tax=Lathyrus oleraceus subsp. biflorus TaxID=47742 RepID=A0A385JDW0_PEA|nr:acetyl-CoA carboxylase beta subunit [Pisum sativum subsp. elatius]